MAVPGNTFSLQSVETSCSGRDEGCQDDDSAVGQRLQLCLDAIPSLQYIK